MPHLEPSALQIVGQADHQDDGPVASVPPESRRRDPPARCASNGSAERFDPDQQTTRFLPVVPGESPLLLRWSVRAVSRRVVLASLGLRSRSFCRTVALTDAGREAVGYGRASKTRLSGVSVARRKRPNPPSATTSRRRASPAWAPSARPTSWSLDAGTQRVVEAE